MNELTYGVSGSFGSVISGSDPLDLHDHIAEMHAMTQTTATPISTTAYSATYSLPAGAVYLLFGNYSYYSSANWNMTITLGSSGDTLVLSGPGPTGTVLAGTAFKWTIPLLPGSWKKSVLSHPALPFPPQRMNLPTPASNLEYCSRQ